LAPPSLKVGAKVLFGDDLKGEFGSLDPGPKRISKGDPVWQMSSQIEQEIEGRILDVVALL